VLNRFLHFLIRGAFVEDNRLDFYAATAESGNKCICDPGTIVAVGYRKIEHS